jgi:hypothetical protein
MNKKTIKRKTMGCGCKKGSTSKPKPKAKK